MGRIKKEEKNRATDACRVPPGLSHRSWFVATVNKLKKPDGLPDTSNIDLGLFITFCVILLFFIPLWNSPYSLGASLQVSQGEEVDWNNGFEIVAMPYEGLTETLLLNSTPYDGSSIWDTGSYFLDAITRSDERGYTISIPGLIGNDGFFSCSTTTSVSIPDINELFFSVVLDGLEGSCNVTLSAAFTDIGLENYYAELFHRSITSELYRGETLNLTLSTPVALLKTISSVWLSRVVMDIYIVGTPSATLIIKDTTIKAISDKPLFPVTIDAIATTGESLYSSYITRYLRNPPVIFLNRTGEDGSPALFLRRGNYTVFLPQGQYSAIAGWYNFYMLIPVIDAQEITFEVIPDETIHLRLKMRAIILDINSNVPIPFRSMQVRLGDSDDLIYTPWRYAPWPDHLYVPPIQGDIWISVSFDQWYVDSWANMSIGYTHIISFFSPLTINIFGLLLNFGQLLDIGLVILVVFLVIKRWLVKTAQLNRRDILSDNRFVPIILLMSSFLFPWVLYSDWGEYRTLNFVSLPVRVLTFQGNIAFAVVSFGEWIILGLLSFVLLWAPLIGLLSMLSTPESKSNSKKTGKLLLFPFLFSVCCLIAVLLSGYTLGLGALLAMVGLPIWLIQKLYRHEIGVPDIHLPLKKAERGS